ncbi:MAG: hypothetical protein ACR2LX_16910 [Jatrophihabitans sp.]
MTTDAMRFEGALARAENDIQAATRTAAAVTRELKRARSSAASGQVRDLRRAFDAATDAVRELQQAVADTTESYDVDESELLSSGAYAKELLASAAEAGVAMFEEDDRLLCYPSIVRILPGELALDVDRRRVRGLRPSAVVAQLQRAQNAGPRFKTGPFLASLLAGYELVVAQQGKARGAVVRLQDVYAVLTLLPGQAREYSKPEFTRDLYLLDQSGETEVGSTGRTLRWAASTGTRTSGVLSTVAKSGQQQQYWGIAFDPAAP